MGHFESAAKEGRDVCFWEADVKAHSQSQRQLAVVTAHQNRNPESISEASTMVLLDIILGLSLAHSAICVHEWAKGNVAGYATFMNLISSAFKFRRSAKSLRPGAGRRKRHCPAPPSGGAELDHGVEFREYADTDTSDGECDPPERGATDEQDEEDEESEGSEPDESEDRGESEGSNDSSETDDRSEGERSPEEVSLSSSSESEESDEEEEDNDDDDESNDDDDEGNDKEDDNNDNKDDDDEESYSSDSDSESVSSVSVCNGGESDVDSEVGDDLDATALPSLVSLASTSPQGTPRGEKNKDDPATWFWWG